MLHQGFIQNKYYNLYAKIVELRIKFPYKAGYREKHHIIPKCFGGTDDKENMIVVSGREHFILHKLLIKFTTGIHKMKMHCAFHRMTFCGRYNVTSRDFETARINHSMAVSNIIKSQNTKEDIARRSEVARKSWLGATARRETASRISKEIMLKRIEDDPSYIDHLREMAKIGGLRSKEVNSLRIEYNGIIYIGWNDFTNETGISKSLYKKYYVNGIDPSFRVGKDGPPDFKETCNMVNEYCDKHEIDKKTAINILYEKKVIGKKYYEQIKGSNSR